MVSVGRERGTNREQECTTSMRVLARIINKNVGVYLRVSDTFIKNVSE